STKNPILVTSKTAIPASDPNGAKVVLQYWIDDLREQSLLYRIKGHSPAGQAIDSPVIASHPEISLAVLIYRSNKVAGQALGGGVGDDAAVLERTQSGARANPNIVLPIFE